MDEAEISRNQKCFCSHFILLYNFVVVKVLDGFGDQMFAILNGNMKNSVTENTIKLFSSIIVANSAHRNFKIRSALLNLVSQRMNF